MLRDATLGHIAPNKINCLLDSNQSSCSSSERFQFSKALLDEILKDPTGSVSLYFPPAIECLRVVAPTLKISDSTPLDIVARVEKYTIKLADLIDEQTDFQVIRHLVVEELTNSLRLLFHSRLTSTNSTRTRGTSTGRAVRQNRRSRYLQDHKENKDPQTSATTPKGRRASGRFQPNEVSNILDRGLFAGASELSLATLLPDSDSLLVTRVITSALCLRVTSDLVDIPLGERIYLFRAFAVPWVRHMQTFPKPCNQEAAVRIERIIRFLSKSSSTCTCEITKLRVLSLLCSIRNSAPHSYGYELYKSVNKVILSTPNGLMQQEVLDTVVSIYEDALQYVSSFPKGDITWTSEDFSVWLDHVLYVWGRINRKALPDVFYSRIEAIDTQPTSDRELAHCFQIQVDLFDIGAYSRESLSTSPVSKLKASEDVWKRVQGIISRVRTPDLFFIRDRWGPETLELQTDSLLDNLNAYLRYLHVIDPLRVMILENRQSNSRQLRIKNELLVRRFVSTLVVGLQLVDSAEFSEVPLSKSSKKRLTIRLNLLVGGAFESCKALVEMYWEKRELEMGCIAVTCISVILQHFSKHYQEYHQQWRDWFLTWLQPFVEGERKKAEGKNRTECTKDLKLLFEFVKHCDCIIEKRYDDPVVEDDKPGADLFVHRKGLLGTWRKICISLADWCGALTIAHKLMVLELSTSDKVGSLELFSTPNVFMLDLVRVMRLHQSVGDGVEQFKLSAKPLTQTLVTPYFMIALTLEYQCRMRNQQKTYRKREDYLETLFGLQRGRYWLYKQISDRKKECALHQFHRHWLSFVFEGGKFWTTTAGKQLYRAISEKNIGKCDGHKDTTAFGFSERFSQCDWKHDQRLALIADIWRLVEEEQFPKLRDVLEKLEKQSYGAALQTCSRNFLLVAAEILDWASFVSASRDYDLHAFRARKHAEKCREASGIGITENPFLQDLSLRLGSPTYFEWYSNGRKQSSSSQCAEFKNVRRKYAERNFSDILTMLNNQNGDEGDLLAFEKALAHEFTCGNITLALMYSHKALKRTVQHLMILKRRSIAGLEEKEFTIGGAKLQLAFDNRTEAGQELMRELHELVIILFHHARLQFDAENINNGQYYLERCQNLVSQFLPEDSYIRLSVSAAYHAKQSKNKPQVTLKDVSAKLAEKSTYAEHDRNVVSEHEMWTQLTECRHRHGEMIPNKDIIYACNASENAIKTRADVNISNVEWAKRAKLDTNVLRAIALSKGKEDANAVKILEPLIQEFPNLRANLRASAHYHLVESRLRLAHTKASMTPTRKTTRKTRSKATGKQKLSAELKDAIDQAVDQMTVDFSVPWICRRVFGLQSLKIRNSNFENCATDVALLSKRIGVSFNVRWRFSMNNKMELLLQQGKVSEASRLQSVDELFAEMTIGELEHLVHLLDKNSCTVIGIDTDETMESLIIWRICRSGTYLVKKPISKSGPLSVLGVMQRIKSVFTVTEEAAKPAQNMTNKEKSEWWANRFRLDDELRNIVSDIETQWINDAGYMLEPDFDEEDEDEEDCDERSQVVLLINTHLEQIPWESVGVLGESAVSVTRCPSLAFLEYHLRSPQIEVDQHDMFYLVNPTGEFAKTEGRFHPLVTDRERRWTGICGKCERGEASSMYNGQKMYLYCGHGTGVKFMSPRRFEGNKNAPITLLMGCSSAKPDNLDVHDEESNSAAIDFIIYGAPAVVGTLWDVSDGEIDRFTLSLLALWTGAGSPGYDAEMVSLAEAVARSRATCRTPYLVGSACVVLGAPNIHVKAR